MTSVRLEIDGLKELKERLDQYPGKVKKAMLMGFQRALLQVWESVPPYPPPPPDSTYERKVSSGLGGSLGISSSGSHAGTPDIYEVKQMGDYTEATFGSHLEYAQYVIGDADTQQAEHMRHWWTLPQTVYEAAKPKIEATFLAVVNALARFIEGQNENGEL